MRQCLVIDEGMFSVWRVINVGDNSGILRYLTQSRFVRSVTLRVLAILIIVSIAIVAMVFVSFTSEINKNIIADRQSQLAVIEDTISSRMNEATSVAYNIGTDGTFYLEPVADERYSGYEMSNALAKYLIGNEFIKYLAYYRLSEPDKIYTSSGELTFHNFWKMYINFEDCSEEEYLARITGGTNSWTIPAATHKANSFLTHVCSLPQFSVTPQAFLVMLIPLSEITPLLESMLVDAKGEVYIFDAEGNELCRTGTLDVDIPIEVKSREDAAKEQYVKAGGTDYVVQRRVSQSNGWTYVSVLRLDDIISGLASRQLIFIILLLVLMFVAVFSMLICIVIQYRPISNLAAEVGGGEAVDERVLLSSRFATLKDDSELKQKYETAYHAAEAANKAKSAFLSNMSHDIRTPMNAVIGMTAVALRHADDPAYMKECLQKVQVASQYLMDIINNVLDMSRIESGRVVLSEDIIDLPQMISELIAILTQSAEARRQKLVVEIGDICNTLVICDSLKLRQIFMNILSNSVKFTPEGGTITLQMNEDGPSSDGYSNYVFKFSDTGIGMSPEFVRQVFDTFSRAPDDGVAKTEGTGLGMAIARSLVEIMGGTISCESSPGRGTTFIVRMHMKLAGEENSAEVESSFELQGSSARSEKGIVNLEGRRVLLAEDNRMNREIACAIIKETHAEIFTAVNGKEAVDVFREHPEGFFNVILMDLQMPVMDGFEATAEIRSMQRTDARAIPIYAMTASTFDDDVRQVKEAGMNGHLGKPYMPDALYRLLEQAIRPS